MQTFSSDSSIINYVHSLLVIATGTGEEFDFYVSNDVVGVHISNSLGILEIISYCSSGPVISQINLSSDRSNSENLFLHSDQEFKAHYEILCYV